MAVNPIGMGAPTSVWYTIVKDVILVLVGSLALTILSKQFKTKDTSFMTAFKINLVIIVISFIWGLIMQGLTASQNTTLAVLNFAIYYVIYVVVPIYFIKKFYRVNITEAVSMWVVFIITYLAVNLIFSVIQISLQMKALTSNLGQMPQMMPTGSEGGAVRTAQMPAMMPEAGETNNPKETNQMMGGSEDT